MTDSRTRGGGTSRKRRAVVGIVALLVLCGTIGPATAIAAVDVDGADDLEVDDGLEDAFEDARDGNESIEVVVRLEEAPPPESDDAVEAELEDHATETQANLLAYAEGAAGIDVVAEFWVTNAVLLEVDPDAVDLEAFARFDEVTELHENVPVSTPDPPGTVDSLDAADSSDDGPSGTREYETTAGLAQIDAPDVWETHDARGEGVKVAVLDTGVDVDHPDLTLYTDDPDDPTYPGGWASFDDDGTRIEGSVPHDSEIHGTHVSGTIAGGNASGTHVGVAPAVDLAHAQVLTGEGGTFASALAGFEWALAVEADVISASFGTEGTQDGFVDPVRNARHAGVVVVGAVGNGGEGTSSSPGNVYETVSVGAVDPDDRVPPFSGGEELTRGNWTAPPDDWPAAYVVPDVVAPGVAVESTVPGGGYERLPGTSMATPHVSGTAALLLSVEDDLTPAEVDAALEGTARKPADAPAEQEDRYGHGIVDASAAADAVHDARSDETVEETVEETELEGGEPSDDGENASATGADPVSGYGVGAALVAIGLALLARSTRD